MLESFITSARGNFIVLQYKFPGKTEENFMNVFEAEREEVFLFYG